jgi:hypothetical protein
MIIDGAGHSSFTDKCTAAGTCDLLARTATALFETYLAGRRRAGAPLDPGRLRDRRVQLATVGMPPA